jgi:hypothetical protein
LTDINYLQDLDDVRNNPSTDYVLLRDLDFNDDDSYDQNDVDWQTKKTAWTTGTGWSPIGTSVSPRGGFFDGDGFSITGLFINRPTEDNVGLFGYCDAGFGDSKGVSNLSLIDVNVTGKAKTAGLVGYQYARFHITNCSVSGDVTGTGDYVGGLVGQCYVQNAITNCSANCDVVGVSYCGILIGSSEFYSSTTKCYSTGTITSTGDFVGGLVGAYSYGTITDCYSLATASSSGNFVAGLIGADSGTPVVNCYYAGNTVNMIGYFSEATVTNSFYDSDTSGNSVDDGRGTPKTTSEMKQAITFLNGTWDIQYKTGNTNNGYPYLSDVASPVWYINRPGVWRIGPGTGRLIA